MCESLFRYLLPEFYSSLNSTGFSSWSEFYDTHQVDYYSNNGPLLSNYTKDLTRYLLKCNQIESDFIYGLWIANTFKPIFLVVFLIFFIFPCMLCCLLFSASMFLFLTKHWVKLKVSVIVRISYKKVFL